MPTPPIDAQRMPRHIAITMDGNGRWATQRGLPRSEGHRRGDRAVRAVIEACGELGIEYLTLYTFSTENWRRAADEVQTLLMLIEIVARREIQELHEKGVRVRVLGRFHELPASLQRELERDIALTRENTGLNLNLAINYGGRAEIVDAVKALVEAARRGEVSAESIDEAAISAHLYTAGIPDPDLLIRTSGEMRVSNFLLWQLAYAEIHVTPTLWPDFGRENLLEAIADYQARQRKFGAVPAAPAGAGTE
jgi:undecaprenyl diphosphate synthase